MIVIAIVFGAIGWVEWRQMKGKPDLKRARLIVFSYIAFFFALSEVLYVVRSHFQLALLIQWLFQPIDHFFVHLGAPLN